MSFDLVRLLLEDLAETIKPSYELTAKYPTPLTIYFQARKKIPTYLEWTEPENAEHISDVPLQYYDFRFLEIDPRLQLLLKIPKQKPEHSIPARKTRDLYSRVHVDLRHHRIY